VGFIPTIGDDGGRGRRRVITVDAEDLDEHQSRLLGLLCAAVEEAPLVDATSGPGLYHRLRTHLIAAGATDGDFEFLTEGLVRLIIESDNPFTPRQKTAQLKLISEIFARRGFHLVVNHGAVVSLAFADPPTRH
jgi:hypothetical protein